MVTLLIPCFVMFKDSLSRSALANTVLHMLDLERRANCESCISKVAKETTGRE
jgi:hypothetical protein